MINLAAEFAEALRTPEVQEILRQTMADVVRQELQGRSPDSNRLVDAEEAARILDMTPGAVRKAAGRGRLPCHRVGRRVRFNVAEIAALANGTTSLAGKRYSADGACRAAEPVQSSAGGPHSARRGIPNIATIKMHQ
jgi:excisionase family DNA binding protein